MGSGFVFDGGLALTGLGLASFLFVSVVDLDLDGLLGLASGFGAVSTGCLGFFSSASCLAFLGREGNLMVSCSFDFDLSWLVLSFLVGFVCLGDSVSGLTDSFC